MPALTLRLEPEMAKELDKLCREKGYKKTGLILRLIREFLHKKEAAHQFDSKKQMDALSKIVGIANLGGDAVEDEEAYFE